MTLITETAGGNEMANSALTTNGRNARSGRKALMLSICALACVAATGSFAADLAKVQIGDAANIFPESMAVTSDGTVYAGSTQQTVVYRATPGAAKAEVWIPKPADGPQFMLGVYADEKTNLLYVCYSDPTNRRGTTNGLPAMLRTYDLKSGDLKGSYTFGTHSYCNDTTTTPDGTAYMADTSGGNIMRLKPGAATADAWFHDDKLVGIDGVTWGNGALYVNNVDKNLLYRVDLNADGSAKSLTELQTSVPVKGPDGMRFGQDGKLYLAENKAGQVDEVALDGDKATIKPIKDGFQTSTAVSEVGNVLWVGEAKFGQKAPGQFFVYPVDLGAAK
jgi:sugar lactone lactonase YvrE